MKEKPHTLITESTPPFQLKCKLKIKLKKGRNVGIRDEKN